MRNPDFAADRARWAVRHGLRLSRRTPCGHGLIGRGLNSEDHERYCIGQRRVLLDHASLWNGKDGRVLVAWPFGPLSNQPNHDFFWSRVMAYARRLGIRAFMPDSKNLLHRLYDTESCVVLYGSRNTDLRPFTQGVQRTWVPRERAVFPARYRRGGTP